MENRVRIAGAAIVVHDHKVLLVRYKNSDNGSYLVGPGGGANHDEDLVDTVKREVMEETGLVVKVDNLLFVEDLLTDKYRMLKFWFLCEVTGGELAETDEAKIDGIVHVGWYRKEDLADEMVFPACMKELDWGKLKDGEYKTEYFGLKRAIF